jgi:putative FmdB family regulatory protein
MPLYTYKCPKCSNEIDKVHSYKDDPEIKCDCGEVMKRRIYAVKGYIKTQGLHPNA